MNGKRRYLFPTNERTIRGRGTSAVRLTMGTPEPVITAQYAQNVSPAAPPGTVLSLVGEFDLSQLDRLREAFEDTLGQAPVIVDLARATYIDSTVLGSLIRLRKDLAEHGGALTLVNASPFVARLFTVAGLDPIFDVRPTLAEVAGAADFRNVELASSAE
jgi:anti-sigma B factor antagonist